MFDPYEMFLVVHFATGLLLIGFLVFCWMIFKKTRKVIKRGIKSKRRMKEAGF